MKVATFHAPISNGALNSDELPTRLKVMSFGVNKTNGEPVIVNEKTLKLFTKTQAETGGERVQIDFNHNSCPGTIAFEADKEPRRIAGYGNPIVTKDGMFLENIQWTDIGKEAAKDYEDLSPAVLMDENGVVIGLHSVAVCPKGAIKDLTFYSADNIFNNMKALSTPDNEEEIAEGDVDGEDDFDKQIHKMHMEEYDGEDHYGKYGAVDYADNENHKYPIDTEPHARAAWSYINMPKNAKKYSGDKLSAIKSRIKTAAEKHGIDIGGNSEKTTKAMSVNMPDAYLNTTPNEVTQVKKYMTDVQDKTEKVAKTKIGAVDSAEALARLKEAFLAFFEGVSGEESPITNKENSKLQEYSVSLAELKDEVVSLKAKNTEDNARIEQSQKDEIITQASKDGKIVPLSADSIKVTPVAVLREIVSKLPKDKVPMKQTMKALNADGKSQKLTRADSARILNEMLSSKS